MEYRRLGRTNLDVSVIGLGGLQFSGLSNIQTVQIIMRSGELGINLVELGRTYRGSEEKAGFVMRKNRRQFVIATKTGARKKENALNDIDASLHALQTDYIDIYQMHQIDSYDVLDTVLAPGGALEALKMAREEGKIRYIGITGHSPAILAKAVKTGQFDVEFIRTSHSIPDSSALAITTPMGTIIHTGDFKIDFTPISGEIMDLNRFAELGNKGVLALMADSTNVVRPGYTMSESTVGETFKDLFSKATSRIIVATFASNVHRIQQVINAAELNNRKVILSGRSMLNVTAVANELGYMRVNEGTIIDINDMGKYDANQLVLITTGSQGEPMSALTRIAYSEHRKIELHPDDLVIISATPIPGNEKTVSRIINKIMEKGTKVIYESLADIHVSGHACQEELKIIQALVKPKYFIPVHGEQRHLQVHAGISEAMGTPKENIFILENGQILEFTKESANLGSMVQAGNILVDGLGVGDVGNIVLRDRKHLSEDGLIVVVVTMSKQDGTVVSGPDIVSRGFVYVRESEDLMEEARNVVRAALADCEKKKITDWATLKSNVRDSLRSFLYERIKRNPMILPIIMEV